MSLSTAVEVDRRRGAALSICTMALVDAMVTSPSERLHFSRLCVCMERKDLLVFLLLVDQTISSTSVGASVAAARFLSVHVDNDGCK